MSEEWEFFPCSMGDDRAFIFVNVGVKDVIARAPATLCKVRLKYRHTHPNGLPADQDYQPAKQIEDRLSAFAAAGEDWYVGRVTVAGHRYFYYFTTQPETAWRNCAHALSRELGFALDVLLQADPSHTGYLKDLYPTADDWRVIHDMRVIDAVNKQGDDGMQVRQIDHCVYFESERAARPFIVWAAQNGFTHDAKRSGPSKDGKYCVRLYHRGTLELTDITHYTITLRRQAEQLRGDYDGWETGTMPSARSE
jgi:uncharacterized protein (TIGR01619 family)